jgi:hypothetical protein
VSTVFLGKFGRIGRIGRGVGSAQRSPMGSWKNARDIANAASIIAPNNRIA